MLVELNNKDLKSLVKGSCPSFSNMDNELCKKAGFWYSDQYGRHGWDKLDCLTDDELYKLYLICKDC